MPKNPRITLNIKSNIAYVELNRPNIRNALDMAMFKGINATIKNLQKDRSIRAVIVCGQGEDFCTGLDVKSMMQSATTPMKLLFTAL